MKYFGTFTCPCGFSHISDVSSDLFRETIKNHKIICKLSIQKFALENCAYSALDELPTSRVWGLF